MAQSNHQTRKGFAGIVIAIIAALVAAAGITTTIIVVNENNKAPEAIIEYSEDQNKGAETTLQNSTEKVDVPSVESVDTNKPMTEMEDQGTDTGRGWWVDISTPETFKNAIIGQCIDTDGAYGSQCYDTANLFWQNYAGRNLSTCGTGAAKGTLNCWEYNAGGEFDMIWDATQLRPGDIVVFNGGQWGHIGMAMGYYNNGYITLLSTNQGGTPCAGGGSTANIINISLRDFAGAFRPKGYNHLYEKPTPAPTPVDTSKVTYSYVKGDYFSKVLVKLGYDEGKLWGKNGSVAYYTQQLIEQGVLDKNGNVKINVPFTLVRR